MNETNEVLQTEGKVGSTTVGHTWEPHFHVHTQNAVSFHSDFILEPMSGFSEVQRFRYICMCYSHQDIIVFYKHKHGLGFFFFLY